MAMVKYICPICGFDQLDEPPYDQLGLESFEICPCCGTQFGYEDSGKTHQELRKVWVEKGMKWSGQDSPPIGWNPEKKFETIYSNNLSARLEMVESLLIAASRKIPEAFKKESSPLLNPSQVLEGTWSEFREFMNEGEYELAWDALAVLGENTPPRGAHFWRRMADAASLMELSEKQAWAFKKTQTI